MSSLATDLSRRRVEFLLHSAWPAGLEDVDSWLKNAPAGRLADPPAGSGVTAATFDTRGGRVCGFSWFGTYPDAAQLVEAHDELGRLITRLLGVAGREEGEGDPSRHWVTSRFWIETYAHDVSERESRTLVPTLQMYVGDAELVAVKEAVARREYDAGHWDIRAHLEARDNRNAVTRVGRA
jgi:hypothetical protein